MDCGGKKGVSSRVKIKNRVISHIVRIKVSLHCCKQYEDKVEGKRFRELVAGIDVQ
jgi:hypothetical protein